MKQLVLFLFCGILIGSCTITKRHFGNGYHVEWNRKVKTGPQQEESPKSEWVENKVALKSIHEPDSLIVDETVIGDQPITVSVMEQTEKKENHPVKQQQLQPVKEMKKNREVKTDQSKPDDEPEEVKKPRLHPLTWGIWGAWTVAIVSILLILGGLDVFGIIGLAVSLFIAMIIGIILIILLRMHPEKYKYKSVSYFFSIFSIVLGGIVILGAILYFSSAFLSF